MRSPWLVGHRGAMGHAPENTMASFRKGLDLGADWVECDVQLSKDGKVMVFHDPTLNRTSNGTGPLRNRTASQLRSLDAGAWFSPEFKGQRIPTLNELLRWAKPCKTRSGLPLGLLVEIKNKPVSYPGIERKVAQAIQSAGMAERVVVISFDHAAVKKIKRIAPRLWTGMLYHKPLKDPVARARALKANVVSPAMQLATKSLALRARGAGLTLSVWTVNEEKDMKKMISCGVDAITTNLPDRLSRVLKAVKK